MKVHWRKANLLLSLMVMVALLVGALPVSGASAPSPEQDKIDRSLLKKALANPDAQFKVIVNVGPGKTRNAKGSIENVGGKADRPLSLVGGASASLKGKGILDLAKDADVTQIIEDLPLQVLDVPVSTISTLAVDAPEAWNLGYTGQGVGVALLDSGVAAHPDLTSPTNRVAASVDVVNHTVGMGDPGGHGTHVAGIVAGNGYSSDGKYKGIAPQANIISVKVIDSTGVATYSSVIAGIEWVILNKSKYNIRALNISLGAPITRSYYDDPLVAALEMAWFSGIVVTVAAGNGGPGAHSITTPANDPFAITVGALDDMGTANRGDDTVASFSSRGPTAIDNLHKPDLVAPGRRVISLRSIGSYLDHLLPDRVVDNVYFRLSGTSMAAPEVAGITALLLQKDPTLTPNQVKYILKHSATPMHYGIDTSGAGSVNALAAIKFSGKGVENGGITPNRIFAQMIYPLAKGAPLVWRNPHYKGINWDNYTWDNLPWNNYTWDNFVWDVIDWAHPTWSNYTWDNFVREIAKWDNVSWENYSWDNTKWENYSWDNYSWDNMSWENYSWDSATID